MIVLKITATRLSSRTGTWPLDLAHEVQRKLGPPLPPEISRAPPLKHPEFVLGTGETAGSTLLPEIKAKFSALVLCNVHSPQAKCCGCKTGLSDEAIFIYLSSRSTLKPFSRAFAEASTSLSLCRVAEAKFKAKRSCRTAAMTTSLSLWRVPLA